MMACVFFVLQVPKRNLLPVGCLRSALSTVSHGICVNTLRVQLRMLWSLSLRDSEQLSPTHKGENNRVQVNTIDIYPQQRKFHTLDHLFLFGGEVYFSGGADLRESGAAEQQTGEQQTSL